MEVKNLGRILRTLDFQPPIPGEDLVLNIDIELQLEIQRLIGDSRGAVVVSDPDNGAILAMYSNPSYDPNLFVHGISSRNYNALLNSTERPLINRATQGQYPPASTIKPHLALVGLEKSVITAETVMQDHGRYQIENVSHIWRDHKRGGHGEVDVIKAVEVSCDTFFYDLAFNLGIDAISSSMMEFGFGDYTGIDIHEESDANMPTRGWKRAQINEPWYIGDTIPIGIGQGFWTATPVQINTSINILINRGEKVLPQILRGVQTAQGLLEEGVKTARPIAVVNPVNWNMALDSMYGTVNREHGTARTAYAKTPYTAAGKTGTAQLFTIGQDEEYVEENVALHLRDNAMYVGYAPYIDPEISVTLVLENAGGGSSNAAPLSRDIMDFYFRHHRFDEQGNPDNSMVIGSR